MIASPERTPQPQNGHQQARETRSSFTPIRFWKARRHPLVQKRTGPIHRQVVAGCPPLRGRGDPRGTRCHRPGRRGASAGSLRRVLPGAQSPPPPPRAPGLPPRASRRTHLCEGFDPVRPAGPGSPLPWGAPRAASGPHLRVGFPLRLSHVSASPRRWERAASFLLPRLPSPVRGARAALSPGVAIDWAPKRGDCPSELRAPCLPFLSQSVTPVPFLENPGAQGPDLRLPPAPHTSPPPPRIPAWVCRAALRGIHFSPADLTVRMCLEN